MVLGLEAVVVLARRLDDDVDIVVIPGDGRDGLALVVDGDEMAIDDDAPIAGNDAIVNPPVDGSVLEEMGCRCQIAGSIDRYDLEIRIVLHCAEDQTSDAPESADSNLDSHLRSSFRKR